MSVNLQIGFNNNFITNGFYTKFLGVTMNNTLSWNNHIDLLVKKLSKACYIIRNAKTYISVPSLKIIYYAFFHSVMSSIIFRLQKKVIRITEGCGNRASCRSLFKKFQIFHLKSQYMSSLLTFVVQKKHFF